MSSYRSYEKQFEKVWFRARINHTTQIVRVIQSFSKNEFNPDDPCDIQKANELGQELVDTYYPDRQALVCTQTDGVSGCVHNHILISDVSLTDYKGCTKEQYHYRTIRRWSDEIVARYTVLNYGEKSNDGKTHYEKKLEEQGIFSYKEEIRKRVTEAMENSVSEEDFLKKLTENGVDAVKKTNKNHGDYFTYELVDISEIPEGTKLPTHKLNARSYKLGEAYGPKALKEHTELYERVGVREKFTENEEDSEADIIPKMAVASEKKEEENVTALQAVTITENDTEIVPSDLRQPVTEEDEEKDMLPEEKKPYAKHNAKCKAVTRRINTKRFSQSYVGQISAMQNEGNDKDFEF